MRLLIAGWFSFPEMGATAGDLMARDVVRAWAQRCGAHTDLAVAPPFDDGVDWREAAPDDYDAVVFVCGPFGNGWPLTEFLERFRDRRLIGVDLSLLQPLDVWNPFAHLIERDSSRRTHPDLAFLSRQPTVPVVALCLVHPQAEYRERARHAGVHAAIERLIARSDIAVVRVDTRLDQNSTGLRTASQVEAMLARADVVVTTRLHGMVLALKNGVPALAVDPVAGGAKISAQAAIVEWPTVLRADEFSDADLDRALAYCLTPEARNAALHSRAVAERRLLHAEGEFATALARTSPLSPASTAQ